AAAYNEAYFKDYGYAVERQAYTVANMTFYNVIAEVRGSSRPEEIIIIGAHYDTFPGSPGADDNGSGIAALLVLARLFSGNVLERTLRFAAFVNEEPPFFWTRSMGSYVYALRCREQGENIRAMLSLESIGYYSDKPKTQHYLFPLGLFYPRTGNFIAFVSNLMSRNLLRHCVGVFRNNVAMPVQAAAFPWFVPGVFWSDHWPFWKVGYPAIMVTDTALFRNPNYHTPEDRPETLDYHRMAQTVNGLDQVIRHLAL
ncbi:MAG: M28 family peptidase, partial [Desulfobacterota bacterium]|nr:M28 family peptidase [Thermodesulfobacteriota bacterium]